MKRRKGRSSPVRVSPRKKRAPEDGATRVITKPQSSSSSPRSKCKKLSLQAEQKHKDYTSDGMSFESLVEEDDDMFPDITLASPQKNKKYVRDDIVWAPYRNPKTGIITYWPALVTSVKWPKVCFLFINEAKKPVYNVQHQRLISFDNSSRNLSLKEQGEKAYVEFLDAYNHAVKYLSKKRLDPQLNARRFLTLSDHNDKIGQAKDCLFRLTGKLDSSLEGDEDDDGVELFHDDENAVPCVENNSQDEDKITNEDQVKVKILKDLETLSSHMTVSSEELKVLREEAKKLLDLIKSKECFDHLGKIREGVTISSRHIKFSRNQEVLGKLGPFTLVDDLVGELFTALDDHCDQFDDAHDYKLNVMLPEAIIFAIRKLKNCDKLAAKKYFNQTSNKFGVKD